jgi:hypothetical protein
MQKSLLFIVICFLIPFFSINQSALNFDGINDYIQLSSAFSSLGNSDITFECKIKVPTIGNDNLVNGERVGILLGNFDDLSPNNHVFSFEIHDDGQLRLVWRPGAANEFDLFGSTDLRDNTTHHLAFIRDKTNNKWDVYIDGILEFSHNSAGIDLNLVSSHRIGVDNRSGQTPQYFHGNLDEIRIWEVARTQSEIQQFMNQPLTGNESGLLHYFNCNDGFPEGSNIGNVTVTDTKDTNDGTLMNFSLSGTKSNWINEFDFPKNALSFDGINDYLQLSSIFSGFGSSDLTFEC